MQLETLAAIQHDGYELELHIHASVTELEICEESHQAYQDACSRQEIEAENAWLRYAEGGWDPTGSYLAESLMTAGGLPAYGDPQIW